jgi:hypothetical protein
MNTKQITRIAQLALAAAAALTLSGAAEARNRPIILVRPTQLPELAQVPGQAMILHATNDGRTLLYVEQNDGARLAIFDVTDPAKIKQEAAARLDAPGSFDFVSSLGDRAELIRFRDGRGEAVLDLHKAKLPVIKTVAGLKFQGPTERLGDDGFIIASQATENQGNVQASSSQDYQVVETAYGREPNRVYDVNQVREEITNDETGTTYLLAADGLYLVRRPAVEEEYDTHQWQLSHPG